MDNIKYKCPVCQRSAVIKTRCPICTRMMVEVCAGCERSVENCICGTEMAAPQPEPELPEERQKVLYVCHTCNDESPVPSECIYCSRGLEKIIVCNICGKTAEDCQCEEYGIWEEEAEEAAESEEETGEETPAAEEDLEEFTGTEKRDF